MFFCLWKRWESETQGSDFQGTIIFSRFLEDLEFPGRGSPVEVKKPNPDTRTLRKLSCKGHPLVRIASLQLRKWISSMGCNETDFPESFKGWSGKARKPNLKTGFSCLCAPPPAYLTVFLQTLLRPFTPRIPTEEDMILQTRWESLQLLRKKFSGEIIVSSINAFIVGLPHWFSPLASPL